MAKRRICDDELHAKFVPFSCYRRRRLLDHSRARQVVMGVLAAELNKSTTARAADLWSCRTTFMPLCAFPKSVG
jgi:hypothetical protein